MVVKAMASRGAVRVLEGISSRLWNLRANLMGDIVDQHGPTTSVAWFARNMPTYEKILREWGPLRTHYLAVAISAANGCRYCAYGHAYAFVLHYFDDHAKLFPLDEDQLSDACGLPHDHLVELLSTALVEADLVDEVEFVERTLAMVASPPASEPGDEQGRYIAHLVTMFGWLNACGIAAQTTPDAAHDPINKRSDLQARYKSALAEAG